MFNYPKPRKEDIREEHFGVIVEDPYRWMEDDMSEETGEFVEEQIAFTQAYLNKIPGKAKIKERLKELYNYEKFGSFMLIKDKIIYFYNSGLQNQFVWYIQDGLEGEPEVLFDPNTLSEDGTVSASPVAASKDGRYLTYLISESGSDWQTMKIMDLESRQDLEDEINWIKFTSTAWEGDGFYYSAYEKPSGVSELSALNSNQKIYYHKLGDKQADDRLVYEDPENPLRYLSMQTDESQENKLINVSEGTYGSEILLYDEDKDSFEPLLTGFDSDKSFVNQYDGKLIFITDKETPNQKLIAYDLESKEWSEFEPEREYFLESARIKNDMLILVYLVDVASEIVIKDLKTGESKTVDLPGLGTAYQVNTSAELGKFLYSYSSTSSPLTSYVYSFEDGKSEVFKQSKLSYDTADFVTERHFVEVSDGAKVPIFLTYKKGLERNGDNPTLLYAYGGFSIPMSLGFSPDNLFLAEQGAIFAHAGIRGGTEYGDKWHREGMLLNKQRVFDDFNECAQWLIDNNYTSADKLAIEGRSNGGLLMGAVMNQRPDLYRVVFPSVGVMDMLRYHLFTVGWGWVPEYGSPEEEDHFHNIYKYSPLHNIEEKDYPSVMILTADHDDRVVPAHSFKYGATLQEKNTSDNPILLRIDKKAGHGAGKSLEKVLEEQADMFAFMFYEMGIEK